MIFLTIFFISISYAYGQTTCNTTYDYCNNKIGVKYFDQFRFYRGFCNVSRFEDSSDKVEVDLGAAIELFNNRIDESWVDILKFRLGQVEAFKNIFEKNTSKSKDYYCKAISEYCHGVKYSQILDDLNKAILLNPNFEDAYFKKGIILGYSVDDFNGAVKAFDKVTEINPNNYCAYYQKAKAKERLGDHEGAVNDYNKADELYKSNVESKHHLYSGRSISNFNAGNYHEAIKDLNKLIDTNSDRFSYRYRNLYSMRGRAWENLENYQKAYDDFSKVIELYPSYHKAYHRKGIINLRLDNYQGALEDFNDAIRLSPYSGRFFYSRAIANYYLHNYKEAVEDFTNSITKMFNKPAEAFYGRALAKLELGDYRGVTKDIDEYINNESFLYLSYSDNTFPRKDKEKNKDAFTNAYYLSGYANDKLDRLDHAIDDYNNCIEYNPNFAKCYLSRGKNKIKLNRINSGCTDLSKAGELGEDPYELIQKHCN